MKERKTKFICRKGNKFLKKVISVNMFKRTAVAHIRFTF